MTTKYHFAGTQIIFGVEQPTCFLVSDIWFFPDGSLDPVVLTHFPTATHFSWVTVDGVVHCSCAVSQFWSYPCFGHAFATVHPPLLLGSAWGISLAVLCGLFYVREKGLLGHSLHFQSFLNVNCTIHSSQN